MAGSDKDFRPAECYFEHSFAPRTNDGASSSIILSHDPVPGSVTVVVPTADEQAMAGLKEIKKLNDLLKKPTTELYKWDTSLHALTTMTSDQPTTAAFFTRHLEDRRAIPPGSTGALTAELVNSSYLFSEGRTAPEAQVSADNLVVARQQLQQLQASGILKAAPADFAATDHDPAHEKTAMERGVQADSKGVGRA